MLCPNCRGENPDDAKVCLYCETPLANPYAPPASPRPVHSGEDETVATIIPYKNAAALTAYYLGLFSCFPILGLPMAIVALWLGVKGLKAVKVNPQAHGTAHAWVGIVCGAIGLLINGFLTVGMIFALVLAQTKPS